MKKKKEINSVVSLKRTRNGANFRIDASLNLHRIPGITHKKRRENTRCGVTCWWAPRARGAAGQQPLRNFTPPPPRCSIQRKRKKSHLRTRTAFEKLSQIEEQTVVPSPTSRQNSRKPEPAANFPPTRKVDCSACWASEVKCGGEGPRFLEI